MALAMPIAAYVGRRPMKNVDPDMIRIDQDSAQRRPQRSPHAPHTTAPIGGRMKDIANTAYVESSWTDLSASGKKA